VRTEPKIIVNPTVRAKKLHYITTRSMITIDTDERNNNRNRCKERTQNSSTDPSFGTKGWGGYRALCPSSIPDRCYGYKSSNR
jgi:hypothetical protein